MNPKDMARDVFGAIRGYVQRSIAPVVQDVEQLKAKPDPGLRELTAAERKEFVESMFPLLEAFHQKWAIGWERNATDLMLKTIANIPEPSPGRDGKDGTDGIGIDDFEIDYDGGRTFTLKWEGAGKVVTKTFKVPVMIHRGVFKSGDVTQWERGDVLTYAGSMWLAKCDDPGAPGPGNTNWQLVVKRGADAK